MTLLKEDVKDWKKEEVDELANLFKKYDVITIASLQKVRAAQIQELRKKFRGEVIFKCSKNSLATRALEKCARQKPKIKELEKHFRASTIYMFTNISPFKLSLLLEKSKIKMPAKSGDIAQTDIIIPEGNTGMAPGPVISEFTGLGIPTKIENGSVQITKDATVVKQGETISAKLASVLSKLGLKPMEVGLTLDAAYEAKVIYPAELLRIDLNATSNELKEAVSEAFNLAANADYPTTETLPISLVKCVTEARNLRMSAMIIDEETLPPILSKSYNEMNALQAKLSEKGWKAA
ncbi:MAG: 50S ribosomal protein L10 [Candidatus Bathyarchaeota archaeon]